jgi:PKD repeat protein
MKMKEKIRNNRPILISLMLIASLFTSILIFVPPTDAHILIIGDSLNDSPEYYNDVKPVADALKAKGYPVLELYRENATAKNIIKGMYGADAIIYTGHGGYQNGNYNNKGGNATAPFAIVGSDQFIWGVGNQMREGFSGKTFYAPYKNGTPVFLLHACFSTGWVENYEVNNSIQTIYNFAKMFTGSGANYYATAYFGADIIYDFLNGASNFTVANKQNNGEIIITNTTYNGTLIWKNAHGYAAFVGNWSGTFPSVAATTPYNDAAAETWYNGDRSKNIFESAFTVSNSPYYANQPISFTEKSYDTTYSLNKFIWDFGDGNILNLVSPQNLTHSYTTPGSYLINHTVINSQNQTSSFTKTINVENRAPVANFQITTLNYYNGTPITFTSTSTDPDTGDSITSLNWNFGDGASATGSNVVHNYSQPGTYNVVLTAMDSYGKNNSKSTAVTIADPNAPKPVAKADLVITSSKKSGNYLYVTIKNQGTATAKNFYVRAWYGKYSYKNYKNIYVSSLSPGASKTYKVKFYYKHGTIKVDYFNKVPESNENNNLRGF